jgi:hypothetical protein
MYVYACHTHTHTHIYIYIFGRMYRTSPPRDRTYTQGPRASECLHVCARARASAVPPRTTGRAASKPGCSTSAIGRAAGPEAAHTADKSVTDAVFHAPMLALNAGAEENACAPKPHAVDADGQGSHGLGFRVLGRARNTCE